MFPVNAFSGFGVSGWTILKRAYSSQFKGLTAAAPTHNDISGFLYNPAVLGRINRREMAFISEVGPVGDKFGGIIYGAPIKKGMMAGGVIYYDAGTAELNWLENGQLKTKNARAQIDTLGIMSYEHKILDNLLGGITIKGARSELAEMKRAHAYAGDLGFYFLPWPNISFSLALQNLGKSSRFEGKKSPLPLAAYFGSGFVYKLKYSYVLGVAGVTYYSKEDKAVPETGFEIGYDFISLNGGYEFVAHELNMHIGLRVLFKNITVGYAYVPGNYLDTTHRMTVNYRFDSQR